MALRSRGYLPHLEDPHSTYFVTFRLAGSLPKSVREDVISECKHIESFASRQKRDLTDFEKRKLRYLFSNKMQEYLDSSKGECWLRIPEIAKIMVDAMQHFNEERYHLHAWCVMPNHVHVVFNDLGVCALDSMIHSWKSFVAHQANKILKRTGSF